MPISSVKKWEKPFDQMEEKKILGKTKNVPNNKKESFMVILKHKKRVRDALNSKKSIKNSLNARFLFFIYLLIGYI